MAKELTIRIKIHYGKPPEQPKDDFESIKSIITKVTAAIIGILAIIIVFLPDNEEPTKQDTATQKNITTMNKQPSPTNPPLQPKAVSAKPSPTTKKKFDDLLKNKISLIPQKKPQPTEQVEQNKKVITANQTIKTQLTSGVKKLKPIDNLGSTISPINNKHTSTIYYHTIIEGQKGNKLTHRWIYKDRTVANITSDITQTKQIMYSSKKITKGMTGNWQIQILDQRNNVLKSDNFTFIAK